MRKMLFGVLAGVLVFVVSIAAMVAAAWFPAGGAIASVYPDPVSMTNAARAAVEAAPRPAHDRDLPTAVVAIGSTGANVADSLAPYEVLSESGEFNVYTAAPVRRPLPLTGGLDLVPDYTFAELDRRFQAGVDVVFVPEVPDVEEESSQPLLGWVAKQASEGATVVGVCVGVEVLVKAGLLDGKEATSHWLKLGLGGMAKRYPEVEWTQGVRYVDTGQIITTAGVLSGVDGALRVVERQAGQHVARQTAAAVGWRDFQPGRSATIPVPRLGARDAVALLNMGYRNSGEMGVALTNGVGEIELASAFRPYTALSFVAEPRPLTLDGSAIRSRHGLTFVPRSTLAEVVDDLDRLVVPGRAAAAAADPALARAAAVADVEVDYLHTRREFPFDAALRDVAATTDVATATWVAKTLEYRGRTELTGSAWPWGLTARVLLVGAAGASVALGAWWVLVRRHLRRRAQPW
jgi:putative intracellular protease/amidase